MSYQALYDNCDLPDSHDLYTSLSVTLVMYFNEQNIEISFIYCRPPRLKNLKVSIILDAI